MKKTMHLRPALLCCVLIVVFYNSFSQQFGGTPSSVKWRQINTGTSRVIFPKGIDSIAERVTSVIHQLQANYSSSIGGRIKKVNIVLQKDITVSNGYVALAPYRSEYYLMPPQNAFQLGAQNWADNLAIHEFRHVQQYSNFNVGGARVFSALFGENGQAFANAAAIPNWFFEGDAVYNETMLSKQGRGRLPFFFKGYKSLYFENRHYSYMQLRNGSLRRYIPGHYDLGYLLVAYGREKYGNDFWQKVTHDAASFKPLFYPLQGTVKRYAGINYHEFVKDAFAFYQKQWDNEKTQKFPDWITGIEKNNVVNYKYPYTAEDGSIVALKNTNRDIPMIFLIRENGIESKIAVRDITYDDYFSFNNNKIVYTSYQPDVRWGNRDFSIVKVLDINTGMEKRISSRTKYFSPDISHNGKTIAVVEMKENMQSDLVLLDEDGTVVKRFSSDHLVIYSHPKFSADDRSLYVMLRNNSGEMAIEKRNIDDGSASIVLPFANRILGFPVVNGDTLLYSCSNNGQDEIWAYINAQQKNYRLASYQTGLYQATLTANGQLVSSAFTSNGYRLAKFQPQWEQVNDSDTLTNLYVTKPFNENDNRLLQTISFLKYPVSKYPKLFHPFNFHSWSPYLDYPDYWFTVFGENVLNTLQSQVYYNYNSNENYSRVGYTAIYGGWYVQPIIDINQTWKRKGQLNQDTTLYWNEFKAAAGLRLPLNLSGGKQFRSLTITSTYNINNVQWSGLAKKLLNDLRFNYLETRLTYNARIQKAPLQILPRWGQSLSLQFRNIVNTYTGHQFLASASLFLPGVVKTHNLVLDAAWQSRDTAGNYTFTNNFPFSRGYKAFDFPRTWKLGANYHFPFAYPDWGFANIIYFYRLRANAFYDYTQVKSLRTGNRYQFKSFGAEIYFDTQWWNQQQLTFGIRYSRLIDYRLAGMQPNQWEIILPVTIFR